VQAASGATTSCAGGTDGGVLSDAVTYCPATNTITYDAGALQKAHDEIGDFASGTLLAAEWSSSVQHQLGHAVGTAAARTTAECLTGAWVANVAGVSSQSAGSGSSLSPGDLDEAVTVLLTGSTGGQDRGTGFARVSAFRTGFKHGASSCLKSS
jgi:predicted metalloprotease